MQSSIMRALSGALTVLVLLAGATYAQEDASSMLKAGRKQEKNAAGKKGAERERELRAALDIYRKVPARWPAARRESATAWLEIAELHGRLGESEEAVAATDKSLSVDGETAVHARALVLRAKLLRKAKDLAGARAALERLLEEHPEERARAAGACLTLGSIAKQQKRWATAEKWGRRVLEAYGDRWREVVDGCDLICSVFVKRRQWAAAAKTLEELDLFIRERFKDHEKWPSVQKGMNAMTSRRMLTPLPVEDEN